MEALRLGKTNLIVGRSGFSALPIQRVPFDAAVGLLRKAFEKLIMDVVVNFVVLINGYL
jgi:hypothetical protein